MSTDERIAIVLSNLRAEGGPILAADLIEVWQGQGIVPVLFLLNDAHEDLAARFAGYGLDVVRFGIPTIGLRDYPALFARMRAACRRHAIRAVLSVPNGVHAVLFAGARAGGARRTVVHVGNYPWHWEAHFPKYRRLMRAGRRVTDHVVCVTDHVAQGVAEHVGDCGRRGTEVIRNGIDLTRFRQARPGGDGPHRLVMVGRLESGKDHATLIAALAMLHARGHPAQLEIIGTGTLEGRLRQQVTEAGLGAAVTFAGMRTDIPERLAQADGFVFSVRGEEGLGIALIEAMASGLPCIASDVGACREVLAGGAAGLLVPPDDPDALATAIASVLSTDGLATQLGQAARNRAADFDRTLMAARYLALLRGAA